MPNTERSHSGRSLDPLQGMPDVHGSVVPAGASDHAGPVHGSGLHQGPSLCLDTDFRGPLPSEALLDAPASQGAVTAPQPVP